MSLSPYSRQLTLEEIQGLSDDELRKRIIPNIWDDQRFAPFLEIEVVDQAYDVLKGMHVWTTARLRESPKKSDERREWLEKQERIAVRQAQLRDEIKRLNIEENETTDDKLRRISKFAFELASALEAAGAIAVLNALKVDVDCTGMQFLNNYRAKHEARAAA